MRLKRFKYLLKNSQVNRWNFDNLTQARIFQQVTYQLGARRNDIRDRLTAWSNDCNNETATVTIITFTMAFTVNSSMSSTNASNAIGKFNQIL